MPLQMGVNGATRHGASLVNLIVLLQNGHINEDLRRFRTLIVMPRGRHVYIHAGQSSIDHGCLLLVFWFPLVLYTKTYCNLFFTMPW